MINENRLLNEFIELVSVPCPSKDEKAEAELIMAKLRALGLEPVMDKANEKPAAPAAMCGPMSRALCPTHPRCFLKRIWTP